MAILCFTGFETGTTASENAGLTISGASTGIQGTVKRTGGYSLQVDPGVGGNYQFNIGTLSATTLQWTTISTATIYLTFYFRVDTLPNATDGSIGIVVGYDTSAAKKWYCQIKSTGVLEFRDSANSVIATGTTVLSTATWYRIDIKGGTGASAAFEVRINGVSEISGTCNQTTSNHLRVALGPFTAIVSAAPKFYYDDVVMTDSAYFGDPSVNICKPTANGTTFQWTAGTAPSDYTTVDEVPASDVDYIQCSTAGTQRSLVQIQDTGTVGITGVVEAVTAWCRFAELISVTSSQKITFRPGSTNYDSAGVNGTTTFADAFQMRTSNPDGGQWSLPAVDSLQIGVLESNAVASRASVLQAFVLSNATVLFSMWNTDTNKPYLTKNEVIGYE